MDFSWLYIPVAIIIVIVTVLFKLIVAIIIIFAPGLVRKVEMLSLMFLSKLFPKTNWL